MVELPDGKIREMPMIGSVQDQAGAGRDFAALPKVYVTMETLRWLGESHNYNRLLVTVEGDQDDEENIEKIAAAVEDKLERSGRTAYRQTIGKTNEHPFGSTVAAMLAVMLALGILIMLLSGSLIINTLNALLTQHRRQIGVMKLVGGRSKQISFMYNALIITYGLIALIIAMPLGTIAGYEMARFLGGMMSIEIQGFRVVPAAIILQIVLALGVPLVAGFIPIRRGTKMTARRMLSEENPGSREAQSGGIDRLSRRFIWFSRPILLSIRNTFRRKGTAWF